MTSRRPYIMWRDPIMQTYGVLRAIVMSFYSADLYRDVGRNWTGGGVLYLMALLAICWVPSAIRAHVALHRFAVNDVPRMTADLPDISIRNGVMQSRPPGRHELHDNNPRPGRPASAIVIDDTIDDVPSDLPPGTTILTRRELGTARSYSAERRVISLATFGNRDITRQGVRDFLSSMQFWLPPLAYVAGLFGSLLFRVVQSIVYGSVTQKFARGKHVALDFQAAMRLAAVAVTPWIVLRTLIWFLSSEPAWYFRWPLAIAITAAYLRFAVSALAVEPAEPPQPVIV